VLNSVFAENLATSILGDAGGGGLVSGVGAEQTEIASCTVAGNRVSTSLGQADGSGLSLRGLPTGGFVVRHTGLWDNSGSPTQLEIDAGGAVVEYDCLPEPWAGTGNVMLTEDPFVRADLDGDGIDEYYLQHAGLDGYTEDAPCVDAGNDTLATDAGIEWWTLTTRTDGALDDSPVDIGVHYVP
jgi:hypothetical protein